MAETRGNVIVRVPKTFARQYGFITQTGSPVSIMLQGPDRLENGVPA
jgi:hypothetical protein